MRKPTLILIVILCLSSSIHAEEKKLRIVSLAPSTTEILFALGLDEEVIGVSSFCNYPPKAKNKPKVGSFSKPDIEKIIFLKPDVIFCTGLEQKPTAKQLEKLNLKVYVSDPKNIGELFLSIKQIGELTDKTKEAEELINNMRKDMNLIMDKTKNISLDKRPKVFLALWKEPLMTAGNGSFIDELIYLAGGENIAHQIKRPYSYFSFEQLLKEDPDFIIVTYMYKGEINFKKHFFWNFLRATKYNHIYNDIDPDIILRPGPRLIEGVFKIYERLYPEK